MPGARFDPGSRRGRGGALPGKPRRMLGGDAVTQPGFQSLPENAGPGAPVAFGGSHVIPSCPVPLPEHSPFPREFPCGALCTCSPVGVEESRELPAAPATALSMETGGRRWFWDVGRGQHGPD